MKNSKYIKVSVSERLPETAGYYFAFRGDIDQSIVRFTTEGSWFLPENTIHMVTHWLHEVPDYEDEMKEMLEFIYGYGEKVEWSKVRPKLKELLTKLKTES